jgi:hypothetical protein
MLWPIFVMTAIPLGIGLLLASVEIYLEVRGG